MTVPFLLAQLLVIKAAGIEATLNPQKGGEMASLKVLHKGQWVETLYRAMDYSDTPGWTGKAPWLWPATGKGDPLPFHGFARDLPWTVESATADSVTLVLSASDATRARKYPYGFRIDARYNVAPGTLLMRFRVAASKDNPEPMPFTAGNHITFRTPLLEGSDPLRMTFSSPSSIEWMKSNGSPDGRQRPRSFTSEPLASLERDSAISLGGYRRDPYMLLEDPGGLSIRIGHTATSVPADPVVRFNVWGDASKGYFSPEPWVGLQDSRRLNQGLVRLEPGRTWEWTIVIEAQSRP
jgi:galactose mutarotase-like enzyme